MADVRATNEFTGVFTAKVVRCGDSSWSDAMGIPENSTVEGWESLFALDYTFGSFTFGQAKAIDVAWDVLLGRGLQLIFWYIGYIFFSDALLRVIERHPVSYRTFVELTLQGPCLTSIWALIKDLFRTRSRRTCFLFFFLVLSTLYVLSIPVFLGAMTGYVSLTVAWVEIDDRETIVPAGDFEHGMVVWGVGNTTVTTAINDCSPHDTLEDIAFDLWARVEQCDCQLPDGSLIRTRLRNHFQFFRNKSLEDPCTFQYPSNHQTYTVSKETRQCNSEFGNVTLADGQTYDFNDLDVGQGYCFDGLAVSSYNFQRKSRCLPSTDRTYSWGFSTMVSSIFVILNFAWSLAMYAVWQDAQFNSKLVKKGFGMTPLRAAVVITAAAIERTGLDHRELLQARPRKLQDQLYGDKKHDRAKVSYDIFKAEDENQEKSGDGLKRRSEESEESEA